MKMMFLVMYFLYVLKSELSGNYYVGVTENPERRLQEHNRGKSLATRNRGPWKLIYSEKFNTSQEAKRREYQIKRKKRKSYIDWLIGRVV